MSAPPLRAEEVPNDLVCSICFSIPLRPKLTPCEHLFCDTCSRQALAAVATTAPSFYCPMCRSSCEYSDLQSLNRGTLLHRIWNGIAVKCPQHERGCAWTGSIADAVEHVEERCDYYDVGETTTNDITGFIEKIEELEEQIRFKDQRLSELKEVTDRLKRDGRLRLPVLWRGGYDFQRESVVKLAQLISRYLDDKPHQIDSNKIYNCIRNCYMDLVKGYADNPKNYYVDMRMLLTTCAASTGWFTTKQLSNIREWLTEMGWG